METPTYTTADDAKDSIIAAIEAGDATRDDFDIDAIFETVFDYSADLQAFVQVVDVDGFWAAVAEAAIEPETGQQFIVDILAKHQPKYLSIGTILHGAAVIAMPCAAEGCGFAASVPSSADNIDLRHQFAAHQAKMIREGAK
jgi:hypothetical protein